MDGFCSPAKLYAVFMAAIVMFDLYIGKPMLAMRDTVYAAIGTLFLFVLCAARMDFVAWGLLLIPTLFFIFIVAVLVLDQAFQIQSAYKMKESCAPPPTCEEEPTCEPAPVPAPTCAT